MADTEGTVGEPAAPVITSLSPMMAARSRMAKVVEASAKSPHAPGFASAIQSRERMTSPGCTLAVRGFCSNVQLPAEHMLAREVSTYAGLKFSVSMRLLLRADGSFEMAAAEQAEMKQSEDKPYSDSVVIKGSFREVANGRVTFWCSEAKWANGETHISFAQFQGVIQGNKITLDYPYSTKAGTCVGPWSLKGAAYTKEGTEVSKSEWKLW